MGSCWQSQAQGAGRTRLSLTGRDKWDGLRNPHQLCQDVFTLADAKQVELGTLHESRYFYLGSALLQ